MSPNNKLLLQALRLSMLFANVRVIFTQEDQLLGSSLAESHLVKEQVGEVAELAAEELDESYVGAMFGNVFSNVTDLRDMRDMDLFNSTVVRGRELGNQTPWELPIYMQFNQGHVVAIVVYSILMFISAVGNITVLVTIIRFRMKARLNRVNLFLLHLAIADLLVTFLLMPLEIGWASTVSWRAGDAACRVMSFFRIFGLYLSGFLLVCISLDRYFAVLKPLALPEANKRGRCMLYAAWLGSTICSLPQAVIFHVERHPRAPWFEQCVTFNFFTSTTTELAYSVFGFFFLYGFPLAMIISCYSCILYEIFKINNLNRGGEDLRRSNMGALGRAKIRTLKMTVMIVATFFLCWTPYNVMSLWYWIDRDSAMQVDQRVQKGLFLFACTNSCVNPMVYGLFHIRRKKAETQRLSNNCRLQKIEKTPYKVRVRWKPRAECLCAATSSTSQYNNSSSVHGRIGLRPLCGLSGRHIYYNGQQSPNLNNTHQSLTQTTRFINNNSRFGNDAVPTTKRTRADAGPRKSRRVKFVNLANYDDKENILNNLKGIDFSNKSAHSNGCAVPSLKVVTGVGNGFLSPTCPIQMSSTSSSPSNSDGARSYCDVSLDRALCPISREVDGIATTHFFSPTNPEGLAVKYLSVPKNTQLNYVRAGTAGNSL